MTMKQHRAVLQPHRAVLQPHPDSGPGPATLRVFRWIDNKPQYKKTKKRALLRRKTKYERLCLLLLWAGCILPGETASSGSDLNAAPATREIQATAIFPIQIRLTKDWGPGLSAALRPRGVVQPCRVNKEHTSMALDGPCGDDIDTRIMSRACAGW